MIKLSEYLDVFIENLLKSRLFDFLLLNSIIFREDYPLAMLGIHPEQISPE